MKQTLTDLLRRSSLLLLLLAVALPGMTQLDETQQKTIDEAKAIIDRFTGGQLPLRLELSREKTNGGCDSYSTAMENGTLVVKGSNGVALCRGAYDFIRSHGAGIRSWQGQAFFPEALPQSTDEKVVVSPFRDHYYLNVVTYGYTMPYWNKERWDEEIDWMALHGIDMPLALVAQEAVYRLVFQQMGFTRTQLEKWEVGPAHLPWMRMGNLSGNSFDGPLTRNWNIGQIELQKHILERMRTLGMKPIFPAFGGFVPPAFKDKYPNDVELTGWGWVPSNYRNYRLSPSNKLFVEIGSRFIHTWDSIFGKGDRYLSDSFNEMAIPNNQTLLTQYGDSIYKSIHQANPDAKWVMQGWTLGYQRGDWDEGNFEALVKNVPDDRFMVLDMASDYNKFIWWNSYDWDFYPKFYNKEWVWSVIPNMGGKTAMTGNLEYYANGRLDALKSSNRGNLTGYGFAPEGVENNEMVYELLCDGGWTDQHIDLKKWMTNYAKSRYGREMTAVESYYEGLRNSVYNSFTDHPRFGWQTAGSTGTGSINKNNAYRKGVEELFAQLPDNPQGTLLINDLIEAATIYAGGRVEDICAKIQSYVDNNRKDEARKLMLVIDTLMIDMDRALSCHTLYRLDKWEQQAQDCGENSTEKKKYAKNARRIVSVWYGDHTSNEPVCDYAARLWSGMIRDYYYPRLRAELERLIDGKNTDRVALENSFVNKAPALSTIEPVPADTIGFLKHLIARAANATTSNIVRQTVIKTSNDFENTWYAIRGGYEPLNEHALTQQGDEAALGIKAYIGSGQQMWRFIATNSRDTYIIENRYGQNIKAASGSAPSTTLGTTSVKMVVKLKNDDSKRWTIVPSTMGNNGLHAASEGNVTTWDSATEGSSWIIEELPEAIVPEAVSADFERYTKKLEALRTKPMGEKVGQVKSAEVLEDAIATVKEWASDINHESYNAFLKKYAELYESIFLTEEDLTGIDQLTSDDLQVEVNGDAITVGGKSEGFYIYDSTGRLVPNKALPKGTYIVATGIKNAKIQVR